MGAQTEKMGHRLLAFFSATGPDTIVPPDVTWDIVCDSARLALPSPFKASPEALCAPVLDRTRDCKDDHVAVRLPTLDPNAPPQVYQYANDVYGSDGFQCMGTKLRDGAAASIVYQEAVKDEAAMDAFQALGQPTRLAALRLLLKAKEGMAAGDLAKSLDVHPSSITVHLNILVRAALVKSEKRGRFVVYAADRPALGKLENFLGSLG